MEQTKTTRKHFVFGFVTALFLVTATLVLYTYIDRNSGEQKLFFNEKIPNPVKQVKNYRTHLFRPGKVTNVIYYDVTKIEDYLGIYKKMVTDLGTVDGYSWKVGFIPYLKKGEDEKYIDFCISPILVSMTKSATGRYKVLDIFGADSTNPKYQIILRATDKEKLGDPTGIYDMGQKDP